MKGVYIILHNIRSAHNVGSILRTADGVGVDKTYLVGCTPTPTDRFGRNREDIAKVALGAETSVTWEQVENIETLITELKSKRVRVVAVEQSADSVPYTSLSADRQTAFIFGEETKGIPRELLSLCDTVVEIPMYGSKESLNVSVTAGIILFRFVENLA